VSPLQRFCMMHRKYQIAFDGVFLTQYTTVHRLETNKLRNQAKFFAHLLATDALPWYASFHCHSPFSQILPALSRPSFLPPLSVAGRAWST